MAITFGPTKWHPSYQEFVIQTASLGDVVLGGFLVYRNGGSAWIVAPSSTEVSRDWYSRDDAATTANANAACGDWFIPNCNQMQTIGAAYKSYWDHNSGLYWTSSEYDGSFARVFCLQTSNPEIRCKTFVLSARAMRCVAY